MLSRIEIPKKLKPIFQGPARFRVAYGGRGSGKSWSFARMLIVKALERPIRILCARELQNSIKDSVHKLICDQIGDLGLSDMFDYGESFIRAKNGSDFIFKGIRTNTQEIKSIENISICWVEEAQAVTDESWEILTPTIRAKNSEIWISFNPKSEMDPVFQRFVANPPAGCKHAKINWYDNPWFPADLNEERLHLKATNPGRYEHVWEGGFTDHDGDKFIPLEILKPCINNPSVDAYGYGPVVIGADIARFGVDRTVFCLRRGRRIEEFEVFEGKDTMTVVGLLRDFMRRRRPDMVFVDAVGLGAGVVDRMIELGDGNIVTGVNSAERAFNSDRYYNRRAEIYGQMKEWLMDLPASIPDDKSLISELMAIGYDLDSRGRIKLQSKKDLTDLGHKSPDLADAAALTFAGPVTTKTTVRPKTYVNRVRV